MRGHFVNLGNLHQGIRQSRKIQAKDLKGDVLYSCGMPLN
jgi:hypothetical protein